MISFGSLRTLLLALVALCCVAVQAQPTPPPPPPGATPGAPPRPAEDEDADADDDGAEEEAAPAEEEAPEPRKGDVITLKNGKVMSGVQVLRETPTTVQVQIVAGVDPLPIPRNQIAEIQYDDLTAEDAEEAMAQDAAAADAGKHKGETSVELAQKLGKPVTEQDMPLQNRDVLEVLKEFAAAAEAPIEIMPEAQQLPPAERQWQGKIAGGTSLMTVLRERLPQDFPKLEADVTADRVRIILKSDEPPAP